MATLDYLHLHPSTSSRLKLPKLARVTYNDQQEVSWLTLLTIMIYAESHAILQLLLYSVSMMLIFADCLFSCVPNLVRTSGIIADDYPHLFSTFY